MKLGLRRFVTFRCETKKSSNMVRYPELCSGFQYFTVNCTVYVKTESLLFKSLPINNSSIQPYVNLQLNNKG
jgi:hypothetical protein